MEAETGNHSERGRKGGGGGGLRGSEGVRRKKAFKFFKDMNEKIVMPSMPQMFALELKRVNCRYHSMVQKVACAFFYFT